MNDKMNDMSQATYLKQRDRIEHYFDRTAAQTWARLTSTAPVSGIRATVRAGRDQMRATLLSWLPQDLRGKRLLDAGCGTGALAVEVARRGAHVVAIDLSPTLVALAKSRTPADLADDRADDRTDNRADGRGQGKIEFHAGDMLDPALGEFDYVVGMDSLIHYNRFDIAQVLSGFAARTHESILFTFAPKNLALSAMIAVGRIFPQKDRAPFIEPVAESVLRALISQTPALAGWQVQQTQKISSGFYTSQAMVLRKS